MKLIIPKFETKKELFAYLKENKEDLVYQKTSAIKYADSFCASAIPLSKEYSKSNKSDATTTEVKEIDVRAIINTTMIRDSHKDVHINGLWKKSLKENRRIKHLQEHKMSFDSIISDKDDLNAYTKTYSWKDLGYNFDGETEALVFDSRVKEVRNPIMFKEYKDGNVDNHSVGMQYVKLKMAINSDDEDYKEEKAEYDKHIDSILNKDEVEKDGYFWAVYEAKAIEGSAVPMGSNPMTPTIPIKSIKFEDKTDPQEKAIKDWLNG